MSNDLAGASPVLTEGLGLAPERNDGAERRVEARIAIRQAIERLRYVDREIWDDITSALETAKEGHYCPDIDELDCTLLLDLLWLYRHAEPLLTGKAAEVAAHAAERERLRSALTELVEARRMWLRAGTDLGTITETGKRMDLAWSRATECIGPNVGVERPARSDDGNADPP